MLPRLIAAAFLLGSATIASAQTADQDAASAVTTLENAVRQSPGDADALRRLAGAQAAAGDLAAALATIDRAAALAPQDNDVLLARARILLWSGRRKEAREQAEAVRLRTPDYPDLAEVIEALERQERPTSQSGLSVYGGVSGIDFEAGGSATWYSAGGSIFHRFGNTTLSATADYEERATADTRLGLRVDQRIGEGTAYAAFAVTPSADFREEWSVSGGVDVPTLPSLDLVFDARYAHYAANDVVALQPALRWHASPNLSLTARWINLFQSDGGYRSGASLRGDWTLGEGSSIFAGAATYPDTEAGTTRQVRSAFAGFAVPLSGRLALRASAEYEERDRSYTRKAATLGLAWRFGG
ncbi:hypothetical protein SZ64_11555 [Erythrobacter sp. SG61-1L]|uniref:YaiO family outer membrane beta-barrel protein n=1 Tax=Erythrobacter sp. SG61-1L TaxID=1603897 RepID=UPI0006C9126D|nr:YaiO family outer membrane beta-barrel protein [Erythrobacter sp. SG61-1L]KPL68675.1 hypothetical protein SZ64_11555 [Erythrobacter sp. SG61-1L]